MRFLNILIGFTICVVFSSCNGPERQVKKIFKRINAQEVSSASKYIWPEDHAKLYVFNKRFLENNPLTTFEIVETEEKEVSGQTKVIAKVRVLNGSTQLLAYFDSLQILEKDVIKIEFEQKTANETDYYTFPFNWEDTQMPAELELGVIRTKELNLRSGTSTNFPVIATAKENKQLLIDPNFDNNNWRRGFLISNDKPIQSCYFSRQYSETKSISFFTLGYFETTSMLILFILGVLVLIVCIPLLIFGIATSVVGFGFLLLALLLGILYFTYQIVENMFFELFLINLPY
jgi:hypothetical protein